MGVEARHAALRAAAVGWSVFPVLVYPDETKPGQLAKRPLGGSAGHLDASDDLSVVGGMDWSDATTYGIRPPPGVIVVDVDVKGGADGPGEIEAIDPAVMHDARSGGMVVRTPSGGWHIYYRAALEKCPAKLNKGTKDKRSAVDLRDHRLGWVCGPGLAGYIACGPEFLPYNAPPMPGRLYGHLTIRAAGEVERESRTEAEPTVELDRPEIIERAKAYLREHPSTGPGEYDFRYTTAAHLRWLGLSEELCTAAMLAWNRLQDDLPGDGYSRDEQEIERGVADVYRTAAGRPGEAVEQREAGRADLLALASKAPADGTAPSPARRLNVRPFSAARNQPPASWMVDGMVLDRGLFAIYAPPKGGKSYAAVELALACLTGREWLGQRAVKYDAERPVVYVALEGQDEIVARIKAWEEFHSVSVSDKLLIADGTFLANDFGQVKEFIDDLRDMRPGLVVFDTFARASTGANENSTEDMNMIVAGLESVAACFECPVCAVHHTGLSDEDRMRGSSVLLGAVVSALRVKLDRKNLLLTVTTAAVRRGPDGAEIVAPGEQFGEFLMFRPGAAPARSLGGSVNKRKFLQCLIHAVFRLPDGETGLDTRASILGIVSGATGWARKHVDTYLSRLEASGDPLYARLIQAQTSGKVMFALGPSSARMPTMLEFGLMDPIPATEPDR